ncbi:MAG: hypothetical protein M1840_000545 [Geoglossum simile]|nr:MAG: hypothetical protein M1840_000545 [Geoglossum simile]
MASNQTENGETSQVSPQENSLSPPTKPDEVEASKTGLTSHTAADAWETGQSSPENASGESPSGVLQRFRIVFHILAWLVMTGWWIAGLVLHRHDLGWLIPFLVWLGLTVRLVTLHVSTKPITQAATFVWRYSITKPVGIIPEKFRLPLGAAGTIAVVVVGTFASPDSADNTRADRAVSLFGLAVFVGAFYATSRDRKKINWYTVVVGILAQFLLGLFVLRTKAGYDIFNFLAYLAKSFLSYAEDGTKFLTDASVLNLGWFLVAVVPPIIFFVSFIHLLYYWGWLQWTIGKFAVIFSYGMRVSGAEAVVAAASPFVGQGESAVLIKPYIPYLTAAELHQIMTSGFATIAGSVLAAYISMGISPLALVSSCVMSIPASLTISKLRYPETEEPLTASKTVIPQNADERPSNFLHAFTHGSWLGIKISGMIVAAVLCILALLGLTNGLLSWWGRYLNIDDPSLTVQLVVGYLFYPIAFLLGVERNGDVLKVSQLIGIKIVANEFVAYGTMTSNPTYATLSARSRLIATYALCGFGNISALGIQIGVLSQLAPGRSGQVAKVAVSALISGIVATLMSASIAGMLITDQGSFTDS